MTTTNIILGIAALLSAAGSTLASISMPPLYWAQVHYVNQQNFHCTIVNAICNNISTTTCKVTINGATLATVFDDPVIFDETICATVVRSSQSVIINNTKDPVQGAILILP
jgi:hypothetical protein